MPRPKIHATDADKHVEYRKRRAKERQTSKEVLAEIEQAQNAHRPRAGEEENSVQLTTWHEVKINVDRPQLPKPAQIRYIMSNEELEFLRTDLANYKHSADGTRYGTYAYGECEWRIAGTTSLAFIGMEIAEVRPVPDFTPPDSYSISQGAATLLRMQIRH